MQFRRIGLYATLIAALAAGGCHKDSTAISFDSFYRGTAKDGKQLNGRVKGTRYTDGRPLRVDSYDLTVGNNELNAHNHVDAFDENTNNIADPGYILVRCNKKGNVRVINNRRDVHIYFEDCYPFLPINVTQLRGDIDEYVLQMAEKVTQGSLQVSAQ